MNDGASSATFSRLGFALLMVLAAAVPLYVVMRMEKRPPAGFAPEAAVESAGAPRSPLTPDPGVDSLSIPEFTLVNQDGETFTRSDLLGDVTIIDFVFTHCPGVCKPMAVNMVRAQKALVDTGVRFVSVSVDPSRDTPERLREYAAEIGADLSTWSFLTDPAGDMATANRMIRDGLKLRELTLAADNLIALPDGGKMPMINHPSHFILLGPDAQPIALAPGTQKELVDALAERARMAVAVVKKRE